MHTHNMGAKAKPMSLAKFWTILWSTSH